MTWALWNSLGLGSTERRDVYKIESGVEPPHSTKTLRRIEEKADPSPPFADDATGFGMTLTIAARCRAEGRGATFNSLPSPRQDPPAVAGAEGYGFGHVFGRREILPALNRPCLPHERQSPDTHRFLRHRDHRPFSQILPANLQHVPKQVGQSRRL